MDLGRDFKIDLVRAFFSIITQPKITVQIAVLSLPG
jgi:hypothetical protein